MTALNPDETGSMFPLMPDTYLSSHADILYCGRKLLRQERLDVLSTQRTDFLEVFRKLSKEERIAIRLRYGDNTLKWYKEENHA